MEALKELVATLVLLVGVLLMVYFVLRYQSIAKRIAELHEEEDRVTRRTLQEIRWMAERDQKEKE